MEAVVNVVILSEADLSAMTEIVARMSYGDRCIKLGKMLKPRERKLRWKDVEAEGKGSRDGKIYIPTEGGVKSTIAGRNLAIALRRE